MKSVKWVRRARGSVLLQWRRRRFLFMGCRLKDSFRGGAYIRRAREGWKILAVFSPQEIFRHSYCCIPGSLFYQTTWCHSLGAQDTNLQHNEDFTSHNFRQNRCILKPASPTGTVKLAAVHI